MVKILLGHIVTFLLLNLFACQSQQKSRAISQDDLRDKIAGGWAGKMIGVTYGAPTEFHALGKTFDDSINWKPADIRGSMWQDDIYVQLTFLETMDKEGIDAPAKKFQEMFAKAGYMLWHANVQARKNYYDSIFPPASGHPEFNSHADDIDFQIEADYLGLMCPGMPETASLMADKIGHIMNYGDGVYGGIFVAAMYSEAFFEDNVQVVVKNALKTIPAESDYAKTISDVIKLHQHYPDNWKAAWNELQLKWGDDHFCAAGESFNIDAKINGAFIVMGLLYGNGDPMKTMEISTRCGQDSDCNPSSAMGVLGVIKGFTSLPAEMKDGVTYMADSLFINTNYSFNKAVESTYNYATDFIRKNGGSISEKEITIPQQQTRPAKLEISFPNVVVDRKISVFDSTDWKFSGKWLKFRLANWHLENPNYQSIVTGLKGNFIEINFSGTGISINGNWVKDGGKADIFLDGKFMRSIDTYYFYNNQEHHNTTLWHVTGLTNGNHVVKLVVKGESNPDASGTNIYITNGVTYNTAQKKNATYKFPFEK